VQINETAQENYPTSAFSRTNCPWSIKCNV